MRTVVTGGSGSGKSEMAEHISQTLFPGKKTYAATMKVYDKESERKVRRHRALREGKQFVTLECPVRLELCGPMPGADGLVLLECVSNLAANEMYDGEGVRFEKAEDIAAHIIKGIEAMAGKCRHIVIVTNEIFSGDTESPEMRRYMEVLGMINRYLMKTADVFVESVYGIPFFWKTDGRLTWKEGKWKKEEA